MLETAGKETRILSDDHEIFSHTPRVCTISRRGSALAGAAAFPKKRNLGLQTFSDEGSTTVGADAENLRSNQGPNLGMLRDEL